MEACMGAMQASLHVRGLSQLPTGGRGIILNEAAPRIAYTRPRC